MRAQRQCCLFVQLGCNIAMRIRLAVRQQLLRYIRAMGLQMHVGSSAFWGKGLTKFLNAEAASKTSMSGVRAQDRYWSAKAILTLGGDSKASKS